MVARLTHGGWYHTPGLAVLGSTKKSRLSKPVSSTPPWPLHQLLSPGSCPAWVPVLTSLDERWCMSQTNPLLPRLLWLQCFITTTVTLSKIVSLLVLCLTASFPSDFKRDIFLKSLKISLSTRWRKAGQMMGHLGELFGHLCFVSLDTKFSGRH